METTVKSPAAYWAAYFLLMAGLFAVATWVFYLPVLGFVLALLLRRKARKEQEPLALSHASWQVNTFWIMLLLGVVFLGLMVGLFAMIGGDTALNAEIDAISAAMSSSQITPQEGLSQLWAIGSLKTFTLVLTGWAVLTVVWPLKRIAHGAMALYAGVAVGALPMVRRWVALGMALVVEVVFFYIAM